MFPDDFNRRPSPDLRLSYVFLLSSIGFVIFVFLFLIDFNRRPSPDLEFFLWFSFGFPTVFLRFCYVSG